nr:hypothetical protein BaRGS_024868 [Batillaria attramentaria]
MMLWRSMWFETAEGCTKFRASCHEGPGVNQARELTTASRCDVRYTAEEYAIYQQVKILWGHNTSFCKRLVVVFTYGDLLDGKIEDQLKTVCPELKKVLKDAKQRYVVFSQVTDTPGVCDTHRPFDEVYHEIIKSVAAVSPGPHAVLMCLRCDQRFTEEEYTAYQQLKDLFGHNMVSFMIIVFNGLDRSGKQDFNKLGQKIPKLGKVLDDLGSKRDERIIALNNEAPMENRLEQGDEILKMVAKIVSDNNGDCFTDDIMKRFEQKLKEKEEKEKKTRREIVQEIVIKKDEKAAKPLKEALPESEVKKWLCTIL